MTDRQVIVYWSTTWQSCHAAKEFLSSRGVPFTARNVAEDAVARDELVSKTGRMAVPVILVGDEVIVGFDRGRLKRLLGLWVERDRCPLPGLRREGPRARGGQTRWPRGLPELRGPCSPLDGDGRSLGRNAGASGELSHLQRDADPARGRPGRGCRRVLRTPPPADLRVRGVRRGGSPGGAHVARARGGGWDEAGCIQGRARRGRRRGAVIAVLSAPAGHHRLGAREWGIHGGHHAVSVAPHSGRAARGGAGVRPLCPGAPAVWRGRVPHGGRSHRAGPADRGEPGGRHVHRARPVSRRDVRSSHAPDRRARDAAGWTRHEGHGTNGHAVSRAITPWAAAILVLVLAHGAFAATSTVVLRVEGMTWGSWPIAVKRALEGLPGVHKADVSFREKEARVTFDPGRIAVEQMIDAVTRLGFQASWKATR